jgi:septal ring factor EnvC (AmiA/AmiB activator)
MTVRHVVIVLGMAGLLWLGSPTVLLAADELAGSQQELSEVQQQIDATLSALRNRQIEAGDLSSDLAKLETSLGRLRGLIQRSDRELAQLDRQLAEAQRGYELLQQQQAATEQQLKQRLVALYKVGQTGVARALLSTAGTPLELAEKYAFLSRIVRHDRALMAEYRQQGVVAEQTLTELRQLRERQAALAQHRRAEQSALDAAGVAKKQVLAGVRAEESRLANSLGELRARAARLAELVKKLESAKTPSYTGKGGSFADQQGQLSWPVSGRVRLGFGSNRHQELGTQIESNGLEIETAPQTAVQAVWSGRVLYASALKGFGNLIVIDHGDKYYSLYGHVASFAQKVGDIVKPQEVIAFSGHEGRDAVYFELRHRGTPVDPTSWLAPR